MLSTLVAFSILIVYAVSNVYLQRSLGFNDLGFRTAFSLIYFFIWIIPLIYLWTKKKVREDLIAPILVLGLAVFYTSALLIIPFPIGQDSPDVAFHSAKILYTSTGHFFNDPITSFPSIYPSVYHIILGWTMNLLGSDNSFYLLSRFHILMLMLLFLSVYLLGKSLFNPRVGILGSLVFGAVFFLPNLGYMFIPMPFHLGLLLIVNSLTLIYLGLKGKRWYFYPAGILLGLGVTVWPAFLPVDLILVLIIYFAIDKKSRQRLDCLKFLVSSLIFPLIVWVPQYLLLSKYHLLGSKNVGLSKAIPGLSWFFDLMVKFLFLGGFKYQEQWAVALFGITYMALLFLAFMSLRSLKEKEILKRRFLKWFLIAMLGIIILVHYIFGPTYSCRIQLTFSIPLVILASYHLVEQWKKRGKVLAVSFLLWLAVLSCGWNSYNTIKLAQEAQEKHEIWQRYAIGPLQFIGSHTNYAEYIFATRETYGFVIFGNILRFNLVAHRDGTYYSLNPSLSEKMLNQYNAVLGSNDFNPIRKIFNDYGIRYILMHKSERDYYPGMKQIFENCALVYKDDNFMILKL